MPNNKQPDFKTISAAKAFYQELAAPAQPIYKTFVRVHLSRKRGSYVDRVVHTDPNHIDLKKRGRRGSRRVEVEVVRQVNGRPYRDHEGNTIERRFIEYTMGILYCPLSTTTLGPLDYEWALAMKIDCDLAREQGRDIAEALLPYLSNFTRAEEERKLNEIATGRGRPRKSNSTDLKERYKDAEAQAWIEENQEALDNADFTHDDYQEPATNQAILSLDARSEHGKDMLLAARQAASSEYAGTIKRSGSASSRKPSGSEQEERMR